MESSRRYARKLRKRLDPEEDASTIMRLEDMAKVICRLVSPEKPCLDG